MECSNDAGRATHSLNISVQVNLSSSIDMSIVYTPAAVPLDVTYVVTQSASYGFSVDIAVECVFVNRMSGIVQHDETMQLSVSSTGSSPSIIYSQDSTSGYLITDVTCENDISEVSFEFNVTLREAIVTSAFTSVQPAFERGTPVQFRVDVTSGSHVTSVVDFGDGETLHFDPDLESGLDRASWFVEHVYTDIGNYTVTLRRLYNEIYEDDTSIQTQVSIQVLLSDISLSAESTLILYDDAPTTVEFELAAQGTQSAEAHMHCDFVASPGMEAWSTHIELLPAVMDSSAGVPLFEVMQDSQINVTATCYNMITNSYVTQTSFALVLNDINVESLSSPNSPDWWRNRTQVLIVFSPLYSTADVIVSMGDGHDCVFDTSMATHSDAAGCNVTITPAESNVTVLLSYEYEWWGEYIVTLTASNGIAAYDVGDVSVVVSVLEWTCYPPVLTVPFEMLHEPFRRVERSSSAVVSLFSVELLCLMSTVVEYEWSILDNQNTNLTNSISPTLTLNQAELHLPSRMSLDYGTYTARVRVAMVIDDVFGIEDAVEAEADAHFQYVRSVLIAVQEATCKKTPHYLRLFNS